MGISGLSAEQHTPKLRSANYGDEYAESDDVAQAFVFHSVFPLLYVLALFYILLLFSCLVNKTDENVSIIQDAKNSYNFN